MPVIIKDNQIYSGGSLNIALTQAEYDALVAQDKIDPTIFYYITDAISPVYSETVLWQSDFNSFSAGSTITLGEPATKFDMLRFYSIFMEGTTNPATPTHVGIGHADKHEILWSMSNAGGGRTYDGWVDVGCSFATTSYAMSWNVVFTNTTTITCKQKSTGSWSASQCGLTKILGINYGDSHVHEIIGTLAAGTTSLTLQDALITTDSTIEVFTNVFGVNPTNIVTTNGQVVLSFDAQASDVGVKVRVT